MEESQVTPTPAIERATCYNTPLGCCSDGKTAAADAEGSNCPGESICFGGQEMDRVLAGHRAGQVLAVSPALIPAWALSVSPPLCSGHHIPLFNTQKEYKLWTLHMVTNSRDLHSSQSFPGREPRFGFPLQFCQADPSLLTASLLSSPSTGFSPCPQPHVALLCPCCMPMSDPTVLTVLLWLTSFSCYSAGAGGLLSGPELRGNCMVKAAIFSLVFAICSSTL